MLRQLIRHAFAFLIAGMASTAEARSPVVSGVASAPECKDAALLAESMFYSKAATVYAPLVIPPEMRSTMVLGTSDRDISGGDALRAASEFEQLPIQNQRNAYWSKTTERGKRLVVTAKFQGWRGDVYSLYVLDESVDRTGFASSIEQSSPRSEITPLIANAWRPPLLFKLPEEQSIWFIDVGASLETMESWRVYAHSNGQPLCTVSFRASPKSAVQTLPPAVQALLTQLDETLGPGTHDGPPYPTQLRRQQASHVIENAAYRPWALSSEDAYDSKEQIREGLRAWAQFNRARARLYAEMLKTYPKAERALAVHYARTFGLSDQSAKEVSSWALDVIFRSFFSFPSATDSSREGIDSTNPWPDDFPRRGHAQ